MYASFAIKVSDRKHSLKIYSPTQFDLLSVQYFGSSVIIR